MRCAFINWWVLHRFRGENRGGVGNVNQLLFRVLHIESAQRQRQQLRELHSFSALTAPLPLCSGILLANQLEILGSNLSLNSCKNLHSNHLRQE